MAVNPSAHRVIQVMVLDERGPVHAGELRALIRVDRHLTLRLAPRHRHQQRLQYDARDPVLIRNFYVKLLVERIIYNDGSPAAPGASDVCNRSAP